MTEHITLEQFMEVLAHNADNRHDSDIWILYEDGSTEIVPDQPIHDLQDPHSWPRYICRAAAINAHVGYDTSKAADPNNSMAAVDGLYSALDHVNWAIGATITTGTPIREMASSAARAAGRFLKRFGSTSS